MRDAVILLGVRGSVPVSGPEFNRYGGSTACFLFHMNGHSLLSDAGSGLMKLPEAERQAHALPLLLTHPHMDHLLGLPLCPFVMERGKRLDIYGVRRGGLDVREQIHRLLSPPLWPVSVEQLPAHVCFHDLPQSLTLYGPETPDGSEAPNRPETPNGLGTSEKAGTSGLPGTSETLEPPEKPGGEIVIDSMEGVHPGGVSLLRVRGGGKTVVLLTDCTLTDALLPKAAAFAKDCDLLLCDGQYSEAEWAACAGYGHNTWTAAARFGCLCGAKVVRVIHHAPRRTDAELDQAGRELSAIHPACAFGREGEEVVL